MMYTLCKSDSAGSKSELCAMLQHHVFKSFRRKKKKSSHGSKSQGSQEGMTDIVQMDELEEAERQAAKPAWRTRAFWQSAIPLFVSAVLLTVGTVLATKHYQRQVCCSLLANCMCGMDALYKPMQYACSHVVHSAMGLLAEGCALEMLTHLLCAFPSQL